MINGRPLSAYQHSELQFRGPMAIWANYILSKEDNDTEMGHFAASKQLSRHCSKDVHEAHSQTYPSGATLNQLNMGHDSSKFLTIRQGLSLVPLEILRKHKQVYLGDTWHFFIICALIIDAQFHWFIYLVTP